MKKVLSLLICMILIMSSLTAFAQPETGDIVILYTNDIHTYITGEDILLSYASIAALKKELQTAGNNVILADAGDHAQGTAYGALDKGQTIVTLMNNAGYDVATLGNHEFDYGMQGTLALIDSAEYSYVSCNFIDLKTDKTVAEPYKIFTFGDKKVAIVGITTPETMTSTVPAYFRDERGNFIYDMAGGNGELLYSFVQDAIDSAKADGADYVIGLGHLGVDESAKPWTSREVIANTSGMIALIDGHSHTEIESETVKNKSGEDVILTQTGSYFDAIGKLTVSKEGKVKAELVKEYAGSDQKVAADIKLWADNVEKALGEKIAESMINFTVNDQAGNRMVRIKSTNMADFNVDAYYYLINDVEKIDCDVAIYNGGGVRADAPQGDWSYLTMKSVNPFGNIICVVEVTGQQILDALEWGARATTGELGSPEEGSLLHAAGLTYEIDPDVKANVVDQGGVWASSAGGKYRVHDVKIYNKTVGAYIPLKLNVTYTLAGANYTLRNGGGGFAMLAGAKLVEDYIIEDYMALATYAMAFNDSDNDSFPEISSENSPLAGYKGYKMTYENMEGSGRMEFKEETSAPTTEETDKPIIEFAPSGSDTSRPASESDADAAKARKDYMTFFIIAVAIGGVVAIVMGMKKK